MKKVYKYDSKKHTIPNYPTRADVFKDQEKVAVDELDEVLFHPIDMIPAYSRHIYGETVIGYTLIITGVLSSGECAQLVISEIPIYFDIRISSEKSKMEIKEIKDILSNSYTIEYIKAYPGMGFQEEMATYMRIYFDDVFTRRKYLMLFQEKGMTTASDYDIYAIPNNVVNRNEWTLGDWSLIRNYEAKYVNKYDTWVIYINKCDNFVAVNRPISTDPPLCSTPSMPLYISCGYDIEVNGLSYALPTPANIKETVFMLCFGIYRSDQLEPVYQACITDQEYMTEYYLEKSPEWDLILCKNDGEVILAFADIIRRFRIDVRYAFNNFGFDDPFICERINQKHYDKFDLFANIALPMPYEHIYPQKRKKIDTLFVETRIKLDGVFDSNTSRKRLHLPGTLNIDMMIALKKLNPKDDMLTSHGLRSYLERYNLPNKLDISVQDMNKAYNEENEKLMYDTAEYCVVDSLSCIRLEQKVNLFAGYAATAHLALCSISDSFIRAGGMKVKNVIYVVGRRLQCNYTENPKKIQSIPFPGAVVFSPLKGLYNEVPTIALDFSSLYPSIMRALWISSETYIDDRVKADRCREIGYDVFDYNLEWSYEVKNEAKGTVETRYVKKDVFYIRKNPDGSNCRGVYPLVLEFLINTRKMYKKKMNAASRKIAELQQREHTEDEMKEAIIEHKSYNQKQLATKIVANTLYGSVGNRAFNLYNVYLAATVTLFGRQSITAASDVATDRGYIRLYGDSVTGNTPILVRHNNDINLTRIDELVINTPWIKRSDGKEYIDLTDIDVWENGKFVKINQIIRHYTNKSIVRVITKTSFVDVTTDHSLYTDSEQKISPNDLVINKTKLLTTKFKIENNNTIDIKYVYRLGEIYGNYNIKHELIIYNSHNERILPGLINLEKKALVSFIEGFTTTNIKHSEDPNVLLVDGKELAMSLWIALDKIGYKDIKTIGGIDLTTKEWYKIYYSSKTNTSNPSLVVNKFILYETYNNYVYDLNTESGKHHAGIGDIVVSNTDSIFLLPKKEMFGTIADPRQKVTICQKMAEDILSDILAEIRRITRRDTNILNMELDKLLYPALYCGKKKYCAIIWEGDCEPEEYISGLEYTKRGKSHLLRDLSQRVVSTCLDINFNQDMLEFVVSVLRDGVDEIKRKPLDYFVKQTKYRPGKQGVSNMFIARMKEKEKIDPILYQVPDPGVNFEYIITGVIDPYLSNGNKRLGKKTDQWEFKHVVERLKMHPDYLYYLEDVIGSLSRFINYYPQFADSKEEDDTKRDKGEQKNAEKYLKSKLLEFSDSTNLKHTVIKRQRKLLNSIYTSAYSGLIDHIIDAYDNNIDREGIIQYILNVSKKLAYPISCNMSIDALEYIIKDKKEYIKSKAGIIIDIYSKYIISLDDVSRSEHNSLDLMYKYNTVDKPIDIIDAINDLIKYQSILCSQEDNMDPIDSALAMVFS